MDSDSENLKTIRKETNQRNNVKMKPDNIQKTNEKKGANTNMKKLGAIILAIMMIVMVGTSFAAENISANDTNESEVGVRGYEEQAALNNSVILLKELVIYNTDGKAIYLPDVDYSYTIAPAGTAGAALNINNQDSHGHTGAVYAGLKTHTGATVSFRYDEPAYSDEALTSAITQPITAPATGTSVYNGFTVDFSSEGWTHPGIYRYTITETEGTSTRASAGVVTGTNSSDTRYLDVYVRGVKDTGTSSATYGQYTGYEIYGYVCYTTGATTAIDGYDGTGADEGTNLSTVMKTNGFTHGGSDLATVADQYKTYNLEVSKTITGTLAELGHKFPFDIDLGSTLTGANIKLYAVDTTADITGGITSNVATLGTTLNIDAKLSNGKVVKLYGIPDETALTVNVKETNDTYDVYTATATVNASSATLYASNGTTAVNALSRNDTAQIAAQTIAKNTLADETVAFTNAITEISPTGYVSRFAPYALILVAGIVLLILSKKHKKHTDEE